jgi:competence ComEA-like helix-hairpin-helix protein
MPGMNHTLSSVLVMATCVLVASTLLAAAPLDQTAAQQPSTATTEDPAAGLFTEMCSNCHDAARITAMRRTTAEWEDVLKKMIEKGAPGTEKDFETVYDYLLRNFGKVNINVAAASEIVTILGLSEKDAQSIVAYRKSNGPFLDFDAVKKVPGVDLKKLDEHKDAIAF